MDDSRFDQITRQLGTRRTALGTLVAGLLLPLEGVARGKGKRRNQKRKGKGRDTRKQKDDQHALAQVEPCWRAGACIVKKGANVSRCDLTGYTAPANLDCTGCNISRANLRGANLSGANLTRANLSGSCLVDADLSGATIANSTNLYNAIFCNTTMPDGSVNDSGCFEGTACCPTNSCLSGVDCPNGQVCVAATQQCEACSFATAQADVFSIPQAYCGSSPNSPDCFCVRTTTGGSVCTSTSRIFCHGADLPPICVFDADCVAQGRGTHCVPSGPDNCNGGVACAFGCFE